MGVLPSDQLRELYRQSQRSRDPRAVSPVTLLERLQQAGGRSRVDDSDKAPSRRCRSCPPDSSLP